MLPWRTPAVCWGLAMADALDAKLRLRVTNAARGLPAGERDQFMAIVADVLRPVMQPNEFDCERAVRFAMAKVLAP